MPRPRPLAAIVVAAVASFGVSARSSIRAGAQQSDKQQQLQQQLNEASAAQTAARANLVEAQAAHQRADVALADVTTRLVAANARLADAEATVERLGFEALALQVKADATQKKLDIARDDVRRSAVLLYQHGDGADMFGLLGAGDGSGQLVEGKHYLKRVNDKRDTDARRVTSLKHRLDAQRADVAQQKQVADAAQAAAADEQQQLDRLLAQQVSARDAAASAEQAANVAKDQAVARFDEAEAASAAESQRIAELARAAAEAPAMGDGTFIRPVPGSITSGFGYRTDPVTGATAFHSGLDFGAPCGTPIKAAGTGAILSVAFNSGGYGNMTLINHGNGLSTLYGHQSSIIVSAGQSVTQGQVIGYVGSTGKSTGCHLHFEVRVGGNPVDPTAYL
ncbi:MAG TPA: M23 family metallopeptidase [Acidimicrobiia bacterium]|nr:M23 family metallopeptidase [Acidimicrobiia bacterium]